MQLDQTSYIESITVSAAFKYQDISAQQRAKTKQELQEAIAVSIVWITIVSVEIKN